MVKPSIIRVLLTVITASIAVPTQAEEAVELRFSVQLEDPTKVELPLYVAADPALVQLLGKVFYSEYRGCDLATELHLCHEDWDKKFSAILNRQSYPDDWNGTLTEVVLWGCGTGFCEINGLHHVSSKSLKTPHGQVALAHAELRLGEWLNGQFHPVHHGHSWATPAAALRDPWFRRLCLAGIGPAHEFYSDCEVVAIANNGAR